MLTLNDGRSKPAQQICAYESRRPSKIRIKGYLGRQLTNWFEGLIITLEENGETLPTGEVIDQAELIGLIKKVRDLGMPLVSVSPVEPARQMCQRSKSKLSQAA